MKVVAFVPLRLKNSTRLPGKQMKLLVDRPLCEYLFETMGKMDFIPEKYVYCSDEKIKEHLPDGVEFLRRSEELDENEVTGLDIIDRFVDDVDADIYVLLHTTEPFTRVESVKRGLDAVLSGEYDSAFSAIEMQDYLWRGGKPYNYDPTELPRTQELVPVYKETSGFYVFTREVYRSMRRRIGKNPFICPVDQVEGVDIETPEDFAFAEVVAKGLLRS